MTAIPVAAKRVGCLWNIFHDHLRIPATFTSLDMARNTPTSPLPPAIGVRVCQRVSVPCCSREFGLWESEAFLPFFFFLSFPSRFFFDSMRLYGCTACYLFCCNFFHFPPHKKNQATMGRMKKKARARLLGVASSHAFAAPSLLPRLLHSLPLLASAGFFGVCVYVCVRDGDREIQGQPPSTCLGSRLCADSTFPWQTSGEFLIDLICF